MITLGASLIFWANPTGQTVPVLFKFSARFFEAFEHFGLSSSVTRHAIACDTDTVDPCGSRDVMHVMHLRSSISLEEQNCWRRSTSSVARWRTNYTAILDPDVLMKVGRKPIAGATMGPPWTTWGSEAARMLTALLPSPNLELRSPPRSGRNSSRLLAFIGENVDIWWWSSQNNLKSLSFIC